MDIKELMEAAEGMYDAETDRIGWVIREGMLIPFCDRYGMIFDSGMGCWSLESDRIFIYGSQPGYWEVKRAYLAAAKDDDEYDDMYLKVRAFRELPEVEGLLKVLDVSTLRGASVGSNIGSYKPGDGSKARGVFLWPQLQGDGSVEYKELREDGGGLR